MKISRIIVTPYISLIFLVIGITGILMALHIFDGYTETVHEILGLVFVVFSILHVLVNWKVLKNLFKKNYFMKPTIIVLAISITIAFWGQGHGEHARYMTKKISEAEMNMALELLNIEMEDAISKLKNKGLEIGNSSTIAEIALLNDESNKLIIEVIIE
jgi:hypothetical protein